MIKQDVADLSQEDGFQQFYEYLREEYKQGKREFRIFFGEAKGPTHFYIHPLGKDGQTLDCVLTKQEVI